MDKHDHQDIKDYEDRKDLKDLEDLKDMKDMDRYPRVEIRDGGRGLLSMGRGRLGIRAENLSSDLAPYFDAPEGSGALVVEVLKDTPAARAGIRAGDVVVRVGDQRISDAEDLVRTMREAPAGRVRVTVIRRGERRTFEPVLEAPEWRDGSRGPSFGPGNRRMIIRDRNGTRVYGPNSSPSDRDEELQQLREEVRRLRQRIQELENHD
jgi:membrane-associated protease RseP (regulator of RpoE activity)